MRKTSYPVSVCMAMYNAAPFLRECIDSILSQSFADFELLIVDDGSTDGSVEMVRSYADPRIRLLCNGHDYVGSLNLLLDEARGKYIARMDADDVMMPGRLAFQFDYMEHHPELDMISGNMVFMYTGELSDLAAEPYDCTPHGMTRGNLVSHPTAFIRRASLQESGLRYEREYIYAEDYRLWVRMLLHGLRIRVLPQQAVLEYRLSGAQVTETHNDEQCDATRRIQDELCRHLAEASHEGYEPPAVPDRGRRLTVIIPFLNEGEEVANTVRSVRETAGDRVEIIVINDQSTDGYDYRRDLQPYDVCYFFNSERKGVAASRDYGIGLCRTPYFLLLDAHMRFYDGHWPDRMVSRLEEDDRCVLCCQGRYLQKEAGTISDLPDIPAQFGAYLPFIKGQDLLEVRWNEQEQDKANPHEEEIPVILGAGYAASKRYWDYLRGLEGLRCYGSDEAYLSMKVWMEGGRCILLKDTIAGHIYRKAAPYRRLDVQEAFNDLLIAYLLLPQSWRCMVYASVLNRNRNVYRRALRLLQDEEPRRKTLRAYYRSIFHRSFQEVIALQRRACNYEIKKVEAKKVRLSEIAAFLEENTPAEPGLQEGKAGCLAWLCHYSRYSGEQKWEALISELWADIEEAIGAGKLPFNFRHGLAGIGWCVIYLCEHGFIDDDPADLLREVDRQIAFCNPLSLDDAGLDLGLAGLLAYVAARLRHALRQSAPLPWPGSFLDDVRKAAASALERPCGLTAQTCALTVLTLLDEGFDREDLPLDFHDWIRFGDFIPANSVHFGNKLTGSTLSTSLRVMLQPKG